MLSAHHLHAVLRDRSRPIASFHGRVYDTEVANQLDLDKQICREHHAHAILRVLSV